ncbi:putative acc synthase [Annulohypoxylon bovei var. microspora]|nr:putative acc synthase [Annulohypoxylon bovei var. microspora]
MASSISYDEINETISKYELSRRSARNFLHGHPWDKLEKMLASPWSPDNPDGLVFLGVAENPLLQEEVATYIANNLVISPSDHLGYGVGPRGAPRLKKALASFFNSDFRAHEPVKETEVLILPGVMAALDALTWSICNEDEGIITPMPFYTGFKPALGERSKGVLIPASFQSIEGYRSLLDVFDPDMNKQALEDALQKAARDGVKVRAVMISNPHNPLGACYPAETLREIARFCGSHNLHLISDEIFAKSVYENPHASHSVSFTSVSSLDLSDCINRHLVHVAYGMGKDFCASGLRIGVILSRNRGLVAAVSSICVFGWVPYVTQEMWANMLEDKEFLAAFVAKNSKILAEHCAIVTTSLDQHKIPYYRYSNAGTFIWVDLRHYLYGQDRPESVLDSSIIRLSPSDLEMCQDRETKLFKRCLECGVGISPGSSFSTEQLGWFRISFTVEKQTLQVGLQRLLKCLQGIAVEGWK